MHGGVALPGLPLSPTVRLPSFQGVCMCVWVGGWVNGVWVCVCACVFVWEDCGYVLVDVKCGWIECWCVHVGERSVYFVWVYVKRVGVQWPQYGHWYMLLNCGTNDYVLIA